MKFSIVVPSFNQGEFLEDCLVSIISQTGVEKEIIVMDGGSSDSSVETIKRYSEHLSYWQSQKDGGQASAINEGFSRATGEVLCWLCSDDLYTPGALKRAGHLFAEGKLDILSGRSVKFNDLDSSGPAWLSQDLKECNLAHLLYKDFIEQSSTFWTRDLWKRVGNVDETLNYVFDWDWFLRAAQTEPSFAMSEYPYSMFRFHAAHKSSDGSERNFHEILSIYSRYLPTYEKELIVFLRRKKSNYYRLRTRVSINMARQYLALGAQAKWGLSPLQLELIGLNTFWNDRAIL